MGRRIAVILVTAGFAAAIACPSAAFAVGADAPGPTFVPLGITAPVGGGGGVAFTGTGTSVVAPCRSTIVAGFGFQPNQTISVTLAGEIVGTGTAETNGSFSTKVTIPAGTTPGNYTLTSSAGGYSSSTDLTVGKHGCHITAHLSHSTVEPGERTVVTGTGCVPGVPVVLTIAGKEVGHTTADTQGDFSSTITAPGNRVGQLTVVASCGSRTFDALLSLVTTSKGSLPEGSTAVFGVFVVLGIFLLRGLFGSNGTRRRRKRAAASDNVGQN
jgi:hypothetical protein